MSKKIYDVSKKEVAFKSILPILDDLATKDEIESAVISIVRRDGTSSTYKFGITTTLEAQSAVGALCIAKAGILDDILFSQKTCETVD